MNTDVKNAEKNSRLSAAYMIRITVLNAPGAGEKDPGAFHRRFSAAFPPGITAT
jgi:hypothetical protein